MSCRRKPVVSVLAVAALAALSLGATAQFEAPAHHRAAHRAALITYVAPAQLDAMRFMTATRLGAVRAEEAREERAEARAQAWRQHEAVLLAARQRAAAVQAARAHVAAATAVRVRAVAPAVSAAAYSYAGIEALWRSEGGNPAYAATAACIAEAESGGQSWRTHVDNPSQTDYGLFQIGFDPSALNPLTGTQTAIRMSHGGTDWHLWTTAASCGV
jgi:hypothetical protein